MEVCTEGQTDCLQGVIIQQDVLMLFLGRKLCFPQPVFTVASIKASDDAICIRLSSICKCNQAALYMAKLLLISVS